MRCAFRRRGGTCTSRLIRRSAIQVWGFDARGRKQYKYHRRAVEKGELRKYYRVRQMARDLPSLRAQNSTRLPPQGLTRRRSARESCGSSRTASFASAARGT